MGSSVTLRKVMLDSVEHTIDPLQNRVHLRCLLCPTVAAIKATKIRMTMLYLGASHCMIWRGDLSAQVD